MSDEDDEPYENTLSIDDLRREVRRCWDNENALFEALKDLPEVPPPHVLLFIDRASNWAIDSPQGKRMQREYGSAAIPYKSECESGAGFWYRIRQGLLSSLSQSIQSETDAARD